ncbi:MAG TPA: phosphorylase [Acidobacteriaceae bacterium]|jgi:adenosylhomocysteine nucleosidase|nr:phosphorylase [Acidobacteriaceae bacterium]
MNSLSKARPVFIAALRREVAALVGQKGWQADHSRHARKIHVYFSQDAVVAWAGMGARRASLAVEAALALGPASELISVGLAGSCDTFIQPGDVISPMIVIDAMTGERFFLAEPLTTEAAQIVVSVTSPAGPLTKHRLGISYSASAVDMEAATVARLAQAHNLPFSAIKAISDGVDFELPELDQFSTPDGQFDEAGFAFYVSVRPWLWKSVLALAKGSKLAAEHLRAQMEAHIQQYRDRS